MQKNELTIPRLRPRFFLNCMVLGFAAILGAWSASAGSLTGIQLQPSGPVSQADELAVVIQIATGHSAAFLYRDSEVEVRRDEIIVRVYPDQGMLTVPGFLTEQVTVGQLTPGDYRLLVLLEFERPNYGSPTFLVHEFTVVPILRAAVNSEGMFVLWWDDPRREFVLERTDDLATGQWELWSEPPEFIGGLQWVRMPCCSDKRFFRLARDR